MSYSLYEQETSIVWDEESKVARIYTASPVSIRKFDKLCAACPDSYKRTWTETDGERVTAAKYEVPAKLIRFGKSLTDEQKQAYAERGKTAAENLARYRAERK